MPVRRASPPGTTMKCKMTTPPSGPRTPTCRWTAFCAAGPPLIRRFTNTCRCAPAACPKDRKCVSTATSTMGVWHVFTCWTVDSTAQSNPASRPTAAVEVTSRPATARIYATRNAPCSVGNRKPGWTAASPSLPGSGMSLPRICWSRHWNSAISRPRRRATGPTAGTAT